MVKFKEGDIIQVCLTAKEAQCLTEIYEFIYEFMKGRADAMDMYAGRIAIGYAIEDCGNLVHSEKEAGLWGETRKSK